MVVLPASALLAAAPGDLRPELLPPAAVRVSGELQQRLNGNLNRLEEAKYQPDQVFLTLEQSGHWPGDTEGRTVLGLTLDAQALQRTPKYLDRILERFPAKMNGRGFFGEVPGEGTADEQQLSGHGWVLRGLCEYYTWKRDSRCLEWINQIIDRLVLPTRGLHANYPIDPAQRVHGGGVSGTIAHRLGPWLVSTDIGCDFIFLDGVVQAYQVTGRPELKPVIREMIDRFLQIDLREIKAQTHSSLTALRALLRYREMADDARLLPAVVERFELYRRFGMTENYENYNWFGRPDWTEPCAVVDSYLLALDLWRWTKDAKYLELAERIYYNGLALEQRANGGFGTQTCSGADTPFVAVDCQEAHWCCTMRGAEGLARAARSCAFQEGNRLFLVHFNDALIKTSCGASGLLELREETEYPFQSGVRLTVLSNHLALRPELAFFAPAWTSQHVVTLNSRRLPCQVEQGFLRAREILKAGDIIEYSFVLASGARPVENPLSTPGLRKLYYGPCLLGCAPDEKPAVPEFPRIAPLADRRFQVEGCTTSFLTLYHLLDARVAKDPPYRLRVLF